MKALTLNFPQPNNSHLQHKNACYLCTMAKPLAQITFDFAGDEPEAVAAPIKQQKEKPAKKNDSAKTVKEKKPFVQNMPGKRGRKSLKDIDINADLINIPPDEILFQKHYYSIGAVAEMFRENQSLIRYWETEFDILEPRKNRKGDRFFRPIDVKNLAMIYDLLRRRKFTIEGAKDYLKKNKQAEEKFAAIQSLVKIKGFLLEMKASL
jgi:DNA-binding transcriptional MerR regulator